MDQAAASGDRGESPRSPQPANSFFTMEGKEAKEGRIGNAFACERCRKHKVRCVPSDTSGVCQRYVVRDVKVFALGLTRAQMPES
jgi:hypothetical protein